MASEFETLWQSGQRKAALRLARRELNESQTVDEQEKIVREVWSWVIREIGSRDPLIEEALREFADLMESLPGQTGVKQAAMGLALQFERTLRFEEARTTLIEALPKVTTVTMLEKLASFETRLGLHDDALAHYQQALELAEQEPTRGSRVPAVLSALIEVSEESGRWDDADTFAARRIQWLEKNRKDAVQLAIALLQRAAIATKLGRIDPATRMLNHAAILARKKRDPSLLADVSERLADVSIEAGCPKGAIPHVKQAIAALEKLDPRPADRIDALEAKLATLKT